MGHNSTEQTNSRTPAVLALADGKVFRGYAIGVEQGVATAPIGEVVFNTSMLGYQEILTDPSYAGQIVTFTYPHIGNTGCNAEDDESRQVFASGLIIRDATKIVSNFRATMSLQTYLKKANCVGIAGIDTRELVTHLRGIGTQMGGIASGDNLNVSDLVDRAREAGSMEGKDYVKAVSCNSSYSWSERAWSLGKGYEKIDQGDTWSRPHVVAVDCGIKWSILRLLFESGFRVTVVPAFSTADEILAHKPDGLFLSNGPGDPATLDYVVNPVKTLLGKLPIFGICLGHQILGQAFGGSTYKLKYGHRGGNHPVKFADTGKVEITVQNHGFAVDGSTLKRDTKVSHINLNDQTVEGLESKELRAFSVQYHPEASPGPHDARYLFRKFFENVVQGR